MQVELHPLNVLEKRKVNDLLVSDTFERWVQSIRDELDFEVHTAKVDLVSILSQPDVKTIDLTTFQRASRLSVALEIVEEFSKTEYKHASLKIV